MRLVFLVLALVLIFSAPTLSAPDPQQVITTSWHGLAGLYVIPTARLMGERRLAIGFNESKHSEFVRGMKYTDGQIRGVVTYGITDWAEISGTYFNNTFSLPPSADPQLDNETMGTIGLKFRLMKEHPHYWYPEVSIAVRDITNATADIGPLHDVNNGARVFLLASKRLLKNCETGRFMDIHAGLTYERQHTSGLFGFELTLTHNASLIAEGIWDSPYLNFRHFGRDDQCGRYLFNTGLRIYPELVPGLALDLGFVGDGEFEFSFGVSYVACL